jgi:putative protease
LIAPAGDRECAQAAVENGADAIYFGITGGFNARARAANFSPDALPELMTYLHRRGVKGYLTLNTLVFPSELESLEETVRTAAAARVDAVLVQDVGAARLISAVCPDLPLHASTQMTLTSAECLRVAESLSIRRVVLARELSLEEVAAIRRQTTIELEAFVHGALCVAYSGQCLTSEALGGRSANRGQCAQACRMPYQLVCDGREIDLGDRKYLLSPQDLAAYDLLGPLMAAGVSAFKIEGRLKAAEYVANITRHYRLAVEAALAGRPVEFTPRQVEEMEVSFSRGFSHGWLEGPNHKALVPGLGSAKRGVCLGQVTGVRKGRVRVELACPVKRGDGLVFEGDRITDAEQGGRIYEVFQGGKSLAGPVSTGQVELSFRRGAIDPARIWIGQKAWKTDDPELTRRLRQSFTGPDPHRRLPLDLVVEAAVAAPLRITGRAANGATCQVESAEPLAEAVKHPLTRQVLVEQLGRLGGTPYHIRDLEARIDGRPMTPLSVLGRLRHEMVRQLDAAASHAARPVVPGPVLPRMRAALVQDGAWPAGQGQEPGAPSRPQLRALCRHLDQLESALACGVSSVYVDFRDIRQYAPAVDAARAASAQILLAAPRIQKPGEMGTFRAIQRYGADAILARNLAGLVFFASQGIPVVADFSLNAANELAVEWLCRQGAGRVTAAYDLNRDQLLDLVAAVPPTRLEVVIHQHMPMFHMEHCVFCAALSPGTNHADCGRPCDRHSVRLRDRIGREHPLVADMACRNTLLNAMPQSGAEIVSLLMSRGVRHFRVELLEDDREQSLRTVRLYQDLLAGRVSGSEVWKALRAANRVGVTRGTLEQHRHPDAIL